MTPHADRDRSEPRGGLGDQPQPVEGPNTGRYGPSEPRTGAAGTRGRVGRQRGPQRRTAGGRGGVRRLRADAAEGERDHARDVAALLEAELARVVEDVGAVADALGDGAERGAGLSRGALLALADTLRVVAAGTPRRWVLAAEADQ